MNSPTYLPWSGYGSIPRSYGAEEAESSDSYQQYMETGLSLFAQYKLDTKDPRKALAEANAKIANYKDLKKRTPALSAFYDRQIRKLEAEAAAASQQLGVRAESEAATRQWRSLGQAGTGVGIMLGVALLGLVVAGTIKVARS
jgi:ElaB/YqjD/DUF883 family membrane-anchored ribosome-binding protein